MILSVCMLSCFSSVRLFATVRTVASRLLCPWGFSRQEYRSRLPYPPPGDLPDPGIEPASLMSPALSGGYFTTSATWEVDFKWIRFYFFTSPLSLLLSLLFLDSFFIIFCIVRKFEIRHPIPLGIYNAKRCIVYSTLLYALWLLAFNRLWVVSQLIYCEWLTAILKQSFFGHKNKFVQWRFNFHPFYLWVRPIWYSFVN